MYIQNKINFIQSWLQQALNISMYKIESLESFFIYILAEVPVCPKRSFIYLASPLKTGSIEKV